MEKMLIWFEQQQGDERKQKQFMRAILEDRGDKGVRNKMCDEN